LVRVQLPLPFVNAEPQFVLRLFYIFMTFVIENYFRFCYYILK